MTLKLFPTQAYHLCMVFRIECRRILSSPRPLLLPGSLVGNAPNPFTVPKNFFKTSISIWDGICKCQLSARRSYWAMMSTYNIPVIVCCSSFIPIDHPLVQSQFTSWGPSPHGPLKLIPKFPIFPASCLHAWRHTLGIININPSHP